MKRPVGFRRPARIEFDAAADWYESRRAGLGEIFTVAVEHVIDSAAVNPERHPRVFSDVREGLVPGFPHCVYFCDKDEYLLVLAAYHTSRDPWIWQSRV